MLLLFYGVYSHIIKVFIEYSYWTIFFLCKKSFSCCIHHNHILKSEVITHLYIRYSLDLKCSVQIIYKFVLSEWIEPFTGATVWRIYCHTTGPLLKFSSIFFRRAEANKIFTFSKDKRLFIRVDFWVRVFDDTCGIRRVYRIVYREGSHPLLEGHFGNRLPDRRIFE